MKNLCLNLLFVLVLAQPPRLNAQNSSAISLDRQQSTKLAEMMCRQLPNVAVLPFEGPTIGDDVHDTLVMLGELSVPCLIDRITDETWMPDPRQAPSADVKAGDTAFFLLNEIGVDFDIVLPMLDKKSWEGVGIYAYFEWAGERNHRKQLQEAIRRWVHEHPHCCMGRIKIDTGPHVQPSFKLKTEKLSYLRQQLARIQPGMDRSSVLQILGTPDYVESDESSNGPSLGMSHRSEKSAAIYFVERWSDGARGREFLRDRYVILFFAQHDKFVRMFSNAEQIPPIFPKNRELWIQLMFGNKN